VDASDADVTLAPLTHGGGDGVPRGLKIQHAEADTEDIDAFGHLRFAVEELRFQKFARA
jgi:hypothetical protein